MKIFGEIFFCTFSNLTFVSDVMLNGDFFVFCFFFFFGSAHKQDFVPFAGFLFVVSIFKCMGYG
jgi:hypothetical protein